MIAVSVGLLWVFVLVMTGVCLLAMARVEKIDREIRKRDGDLEIGGDMEQSAEKAAEDEGVGGEDGRGETLEWLHFVEQRD